MMEGGVERRRRLGLMPDWNVSRLFLFLGAAGDERTGEECMVLNGTWKLSTQLLK